MKRFYRDVSIVEEKGRYAVALDGRPLKTQGGGLQQVPTRRLAELLASEWAAQGETLDPKSFVARDMADYAIDNVSSERESVVAQLLSYAETDTLCYRADPEDALFTRQQAEWEPILTRFETRQGIAFVRVSGIVHRAQPPETLSTLARNLERFDPFALAALQTLASLAASLSIALEAAEPDADAVALWDASCLEERWQTELWGEDAEAADRADRRRAEFLAAHRFLLAALPCAAETTRPRL